jgi:hypothetical protein
MPKKSTTTGDSVLDSVLIGGQALGEHLLASARDHAIDPLLEKAYALQYPAESSAVPLADKVESLSGDPAALEGLASGLKGKVFELKVVDYLNHGHLEDGLTARLADSSTQPGYDIEVLDSHGHVMDHIQVKATDDISVIHDANVHYPDIDHFATPHDLAGHTVDGVDVIALPDTDHGLSEAVSHGLHATHDSVGYHFPFVASIAIVIGCVQGLRRGDPPERVAERTVTRVLGTGAAAVATSLVSSGGLLPVLAAGMGTRMAIGALVVRCKESLERERVVLRKMKAADDLTVEAEVIRRSTNVGIQRLLGGVAERRSGGRPAGETE